jgi:hypothetical protein
LSLTGVERKSIFRLQFLQQIFSITAEMADNIKGKFFLELFFLLNSHIRSRKIDFKAMH